MLGRLVNKSRNGGGGGAQRTTALTLQVLESREVPAVNIWIGESDAFNHAPYWTDGIPTSDDILVFTGPTSPPPVPPGGPPSVPVPPPPYSHMDVTFPTEDNLTYAGIRYENDYSGATYFPVNISFGSYTQDTGTTEQNASTSLTVTSAFTWTGGAINATTNTATYKLAGVLMGQIGDDESVLSSGSKIVLDKNAGGIGSTATHSGSLTITNDSGLVVMEESHIYQKQLIVQQGNKPNLNAPKGMEVKGKATVDDVADPSVWVNGGTLTVEGKGLKVTDKVPNKNWGVVVDSSGTLIIKNGVKLTATFGVYVQDGNLFTHIVPDPPGGGAASLEAEIDGELRFDDGLIELGIAPPGSGLTAELSRLTVTQEAKLWGGTYKPKFGQVFGDLIDAGGKLNIGAAFTVTPVGGQFAATSVVLQSLNGFTDAVNPANGDPDHFTMRRGNGETQWSVKRIA